MNKKGQSLTKRYRNASCHHTASDVRLCTVPVGCNRQFEKLRSHSVFKHRVLNARTQRKPVLLHHRKKYQMFFVNAPGMSDGLKHIPPIVFSVK